MKNLRFDIQRLHFGENFSSKKSQVLVTLVQMNVNVVTNR